jgi:hypothetical protein
MAKQARYQITVRGIRMLLFTIGALGISSAARATALTVPTSNVFLQYYNVSAGYPGQTGGDYIRYGGTVVPNGDAATNGVGVATTGVATTTNVDTGATISRNVRFFPGPAAPNQFYGQFATSSDPSSNNNPGNLTEPWTIIFQNTVTTPTSVSNTISLQGSEIPFVNSVTLSGTSANPTFRWMPPVGTTVDGYRIDIYQNNQITHTDSGIVLSKGFGPTTTSYTVNASDFTVPGFQLTNNITYTIDIDALQTRDGSTTNLSGRNVSATSAVYSSFQVFPGLGGLPPIQLPVTTLMGNQVILGFSFTVAPGITYDLDPEVTTGYIYQTGSGNPNFASVELPDIGNPGPYDLYRWNGSAFVFDKTLAADTLFDFTNGGVSEFEVLGIDPGLGLDPQNPTAFITALTFERAGNFTGTMTPVTTEVSAPEPASLTLIASGLLGLGLIRRRRRPSP